MKSLAVLFLIVTAPPQDPAGLIQGLRSDDIAVRERAFVELEKLGAAAEADLKKVAADPDAHVADSARRLLLIFELDRVLSPAMKKEFPGICRRLGRESADEATKVYLEVAGARRDAQGKKPYEDLTREDLEPLALLAIRNAITEDDKIAACEAAARWFHRSAEPAILALLRDPEGSVRSTARKTLVAFCGRAALPKLLEYLRDQPVLLVQSIHGFDPRTAYEAQETLVNWLRHPDGEVVAGAVEALKELEVPDLNPEILGLLKSKSTVVKSAALNYLDSFQWSESEVRDFADDVKALLDDPDPKLRFAALRFLWECGVPVPAAACRRLVEEADPENLEYTIRRIPKSAGRDPEILEALRKRLKVAVPHVFLALKRLEDPRIEEIAIGFLDHENDWLRREALDALSATGSPRSVIILRQILEDAARGSDMRCSAFEKLAASKSLPPQEDLVRLLRGKDASLAIQVARHLEPSAPELVREVAPRLILEDSVLGSREVQELAKLIDPAVRLPLLLKALQGAADSPWYVACAIVEHKGDGYVTGLRSFLEEGTPEVQAAAIGILADLKAVEARPDIIKLLSSPDSVVRSAAVHAVSDFGLGTDVEQIRQFTADSETRVRRSALNALRRHAVKEAIPDLVKLLDDPDSDTAFEAAEALVEMGSRDVVPKMLEWIGGHDNRGRSDLAAEALAVIQPAAAEPKILDMLNHRDANIRERGAWRLQMFGLKQHARRLLPLLAEPEVSDTAVHAIVVLDARDLIPDLETLLSDPSSVRRSGALAALTGLQGAASAPRLRPLLDDSDLEIRREAAFTLGDFKDRDAVPRLIEMLREPVHQVRAAASRALGDIGEPSAAPALIRFLEKPEGDMFAPAVFALGNLKAKEAASVLLRRLTDQPLHRALLIEALGKLGTKEAIPELIRLLDDANVADNAALALAKLGATSAMPAIRRRIEARNSSEFFDLATALADLGDSSALVQALASKRDYVCAEAAKELCLRGDSRGVPILMDSLSPWALPPELNAIRNPKLWQELKARPWKGQIRGCRLRVVERIAASAGLAVKWEGGKTFREMTWATDWESVGWDHTPYTVAEALIRASKDEESRRLIESDDFAFILDKDALRFLPRDEAAKFWKQWWADEQAKLKK